MNRILKAFVILFISSCQSDGSTSDSQTLTSQNLIDTSIEQTKELKLVWSDEFEGTSLNLDNWSFELGDGCPSLCGWGNNELQIYTDKNHRLEDGVLVISAKKDDQGYFTSSRIITKAKQEFQYGRIETRIKVPSGAGLWPAFWALGNDIDTNSWPDCGEIDIMEYVGRKPGEVFTSIHTRSSYGNTINTQTTPSPNIEDNFHVYAIEWNEYFIEFFLDENKVYTYFPQIKNKDTWPFNKPFFVILNLAIGGNFGGPVANNITFPKDYFIDYVRVYQY